MLKKAVLLLSSIFMFGTSASAFQKTTTVTKTVRYTKTKCPSPPTTTTRRPPVSPTPTPKPTTHQGECLAIFNKFRKSLNLAPFTSAPQAEIECANRAAEYDASAGYHASFYRRLCPNAVSQCECLNGVNGGGLKNCIDAYISEGPPGTVGMYPEQNHGHYKIITGNYKKVACGTDDNGFFTHNFYY